MKGRTAARCFLIGDFARRPFTEFPPISPSPLLCLTELPSSSPTTLPFYGLAAIPGARSPAAEATPVRRSGVQKLASRHSRAESKTKARQAPASLQRHGRYADEPRALRNGHALASERAAARDDRIPLAKAWQLLRFFPRHIGYAPSHCSRPVQPRRSALTSRLFDLRGLLRAAACSTSAPSFGLRGRPGCRPPPSSPSHLLPAPSSRRRHAAGATLTAL